MSTTPERSSLGWRRTFRTSNRVSSSASQWGWGQVWPITKKSLHLLFLGKESLTLRWRAPWRCGFLWEQQKIWNLTNCVIHHTWLRDSFANHRVLCGPLPYIPRNGWCHPGCDAGRCRLRDALRIPIEAFVSTRSRARSQGNSRRRRMHFKHQDRYDALSN